MAKKILISLERVRARQYNLTVNHLSYGEFMHRQRAVDHAEFLQGVLLDLQASGIIAKSLTVTLDIPEENHGHPDDIPPKQRSLEP